MSFGPSHSRGRGKKKRLLTLQHRMEKGGSQILRGLEGKKVTIWSERGRIHHFGTERKVNIVKARIARKAAPAASMRDEKRGGG